MLDNYSEVTAIMEVLLNPGSTTKFFKALTHDYILEVLDSGVYEQMFQRITVIKLDQIPVMLNLSSTSIHNNVFMDILQSSLTTPIGKRLFASGSKICRSEMTIKHTIVNNINNQIIAGYLRALKIDNELCYRCSIFKSEQETMQLSEYVLPGLEEILSKYKQNL